MTRRKRRVIEEQYDTIFAFSVIKFNPVRTVVTVGAFESRNGDGVASMISDVVLMLKTWGLVE